MINYNFFIINDLDIILLDEDEIDCNNSLKEFLKEIFLKESDTKSLFILFEEYINPFLSHPFFPYDEKDKKKITKEIFLTFLEQLLYDISFKQNEKNFIRIIDIPWRFNGLKFDIIKTDNCVYTYAHAGQKINSAPLVKKDFLTVSYPNDDTLNDLLKSILDRNRELYYFIRSYHSEKYLPNFQIDYLQFMVLNAYDYFDLIKFLKSTSLKSLKSKYSSFTCSFSELYNNFVNKAFNFIETFNIAKGSPEYHLFLYQLYLQTRFTDIFTLSNSLKHNLFEKTSESTLIHSFRLQSISIETKNSKVKHDELEPSNDINQYTSAITNAYSFRYSHTLCSYMIDSLYDTLLTSSLLTYLEDNINLLIVNIINQTNDLDILKEKIVTTINNFIKTLNDDDLSIFSKKDHYIGDNHKIISYLVLQKMNKYL